ncbi:transaldolase [Phytopseudomonas dryadis]|uniref:Transaldolase n=1 Tax=Phytopseudomonas dryadis TaxID=2487520 RepID=A0A4Q9QUH1_9GAMM|nr:transaldolase [Pseudomonas dryadis]TBU86855.1 transaldolase [Pseudomonas dryadis]
MSSLLEQLKRHSLVVADSGDLEAIKRFQPEDATTNPSLVLKALQAGQYASQVEAALRWALLNSRSPHDVLSLAGDRLVVAMGLQILEQVPGKVSTEVPASLSFDTQATLARARALYRHYLEQGADGERVLVKIAATWEGIQAARQLEREGIHCNLTLIFNLAQARACAEAGVYLVSPFVGRILDWHQRQMPERSFSAENDPGVCSVREIHAYFKRHAYPTVVMAASFRNVDEILALAGCDRLTIGPSLLDELAGRSGELAPALNDAGRREARPEALDEASLRWQMNEDAMATEKLAEGIRQFHADHLKLEALLSERLRALH